ncbi:nuclear transport factor 2 family protein [Monashia sp. NPDC004114]
MDDTQRWLDRLIGAANEHDLDALVGCFAPDYVNSTPAHPGRGFIGRDQVRRNWDQIFTFVPDLHVAVIAAAFDRSTIWTQLDMRGTRRDGSPHHMTGVVVFDIDGDMARRAAFFVEPVDEGADTVDQAVRDQVVR